ncbi:hypothetical protein, partial [Mycobacterium tuberculosis]
MLDAATIAAVATGCAVAAGTASAAGAPGLRDPDAPTRGGVAAVTASAARLANGTAVGAIGAATGGAGNAD